MIMSPRALIMSSNYRDYVRGVHALHQLSVAGKEDSAEADAIRDATDRPWETSRKSNANGSVTSRKIFFARRSASAAEPMNPQCRRSTRGLEARQRSEWDKALDLLRHWRAEFDPALVSYLRGSIWLEAGDPETAALFFQHAFKLNRVTEIITRCSSMRLNITDPAATREEVN